MTIRKSNSIHPFHESDYQSVNQQTFTCNKLAKLAPLGGDIIVQEAA